MLRKRDHSLKFTDGMIPCVRHAPQGDGWWPAVRSGQGVATREICRDGEHAFFLKRMQQWLYKSMYVLKFIDLYSKKRSILLLY